MMPVGQEWGKLTCKNMNKYHSANELRYAGSTKNAFLGIYSRMS